MQRLNRRTFLSYGGATLAAAMLPACVKRAFEIPATTENGTITDVKHVVILIQENRGFDHYFGTLPGVRGFGDRLTVPQASGDSVWHQRDVDDNVVLPFHLDSDAGNAQRSGGTPHSWFDAQLAWNNGSFGKWPTFKQQLSMGYFAQKELEFQFALAEAFTVCDAYHCSIHGSTNPNRLFAFAGANGHADAEALPAIYNTNDNLGPAEKGFTFTTYAERLEEKGVSWKVYQDMDDNFTDNPLEGFKTFREAWDAGDPIAPLYARGLTSNISKGEVEGLRDDVLAGTLPHVSWVIAPAAFSEHPIPSSPVQGGAFTARVLEALTADPEVWGKTVLFVTYDENDGFFDHVPPPCAPSIRPDGSLAGASTMDDSAERFVSDKRPFGPGPRVPMIVVSPFSRGGWVNSETFDHTSILRFLEERFRIEEPNISPYRRAICGDLRSAFDFATPNDDLPSLPTLSPADATAIRAAQEALEDIAVPLNAEGVLPVQAPGSRRARALPYELDVTFAQEAGEVVLSFVVTGEAGAVFHVYDMLALDEIPRRYAVGAGESLTDKFGGGVFDLFILGPNGFHRRFRDSLDASGSGLETKLVYAPKDESVSLRLTNTSAANRVFVVSTLAAYRDDGPWRYELAAGASVDTQWELVDSGRWYDLSVGLEGAPEPLRRFAGHLENGTPSISDPALGDAL